MSVVKELRLKIRPVSYTAVEPLASVLLLLHYYYITTTLLLFCLRSMVRALCTRQTGPGLCLEGDDVYEL